METEHVPVLEPRLDAVQRAFIAAALGVWQIGRGYRYLAHLPLDEMGLVDWNTFDVEAERWRAAVADPSPSVVLSPRDWTFVLLLTEIGWTSAHLGGAGTTFTSSDPAEGLAILRSIQATLSQVVALEMVLPDARHSGARPVGLTEPAVLGSDNPRTDPRWGAPLTVAERRMLWSAATLAASEMRCSPALLSALGFSGWAAVDALADRVRGVVASSDSIEELEERAQAQMLVLTELCLGSDLLGTGRRFAAATGMTDSIAI